jgi:aminoglycoside phosphotransferase (APT) family kinase protein
VSPEAPDPERLRAWLSEELDRLVARVGVELLPTGYANGAWRLDVELPEGHECMVLKAPRTPSIVHDLHPTREAKVVRALGRAGAPVPAVVAVDEGSRAVGRPCFVMEWVEGRSVPDAFPGGYHGDGWFRDRDAAAQRAIWDSFHDALAALHSVDPAAIAAAYDGPVGAVDVLAYWRAALLDAAPAEAVPRHLAVFDRLLAALPASADAPLAVCMGDSRLVNGIVRGDAVRALVDFEVVYVGNPVADVGYSLFLERAHRAQGFTSPGIPPEAEAETWARWSAATGRPAQDVDYWTAFGATIIVVTAARAMAQWGPPGSFVEEHNGLLPAWEALSEELA